MITFSVVLATITALAWTTAFADAQLVYMNPANGSKSSTIYIHGKMMRMESARTNQTTLLDVSNNSITVINPDDKTYTILDKQALAKIRQSMDAVMAQMKSRLDQMPPEQRAMIEQHMSGARHTKPARVTHTGKMKTVAGYRCEMVTIELHTGNTSESLCVAPAAKLGISTADTSTMYKMSDVLKEFARAMGDSSGASVPDFRKIKGIPVKTTQHSTHHEVTEVIKSVSTKVLPADLFRIPAGYKQKLLEKMHP